MKSKFLILSPPDFHLAKCEHNAFSDAWTLPKPQIVGSFTVAIITSVSTSQSFHVPIFIDAGCSLTLLRQTHVEQRREETTLAHGSWLPFPLCPVRKTLFVKRPECSPISAPNCFSNAALYMEMTRTGQLVDSCPAKKLPGGAQGGVEHPRKVNLDFLSVRERPIAGQCCACSSSLVSIRRKEDTSLPTQQPFFIKAQLHLK